MHTKSPRRMHPPRDHTLRHHFVGALLLLAVPIVAGTLMMSHPVEAAWQNEGCSGCGTATWCNVYGGQSHDCHSGNASGAQCSTEALCHWSQSNSSSSSSSSSSSNTSTSSSSSWGSGTGASSTASTSTSGTSSNNSQTGWSTSGLQNPLSQTISSTTSGFNNTVSNETGSYTYNGCASRTGGVTAYNTSTGKSYCTQAGQGCPAGEQQINGDGVCQGTGTDSAGAYAQWTFSACVNGKQTEYSHNVNTGAITSTSQVTCVSGSQTTQPTSTPPTYSQPTYTPTTTTQPTYTPSTTTYTPPPTSTSPTTTSTQSAACPAGEHQHTTTTYTTQQDCTPITERELVTTYESVPVTEEGVRYVTEPYTVTEDVPVTSYYWDTQMNCYDNWNYLPGIGWYPIRACNGGWASHTTYQEQTVTQWRTVPQDYTYTAYVTRPITSWRDVATGAQSCTSVQVPHSSTTCIPNVTVTSHTITSQVLSACMPNPALTTYRGQTIQPPTNDNWVKQGGAQPNTLLPGPGWAIEKTIKTRVTNTCKGSGSNQTCVTTETPIGTTYQEQYNATQCPYPVERFTNVSGN